jgi:hypothetical protein
MRAASRCNPAGRPKGTGHLLAESFKRDLVDEWKRRGAEALKELTPHQLACKSSTRPRPLTA